LRAQQPTSNINNSNNKNNNNNNTTTTTTTTNTNTRQTWLKHHRLAQLSGPSLKPATALPTRHLLTRHLRTVGVTKCLTVTAAGKV
jgi:hypothetical protein